MISFPFQSKFKGNVFLKENSKMPIYLHNFIEYHFPFYLYFPQFNFLYDIYIIAFYSFQRIEYIKSYNNIKIFMIIKLFSCMIFLFNKVFPIFLESFCANDNEISFVRAIIVVCIIHLFFEGKPVK